MSLDHALDYIVKGECLPIDTTRVLLDHDNENNLSTDPEERYQQCRHMLSDSTLVMPANVAASSKSWWSCCCANSTAFSFATWFKGLSCSFEPQPYKIEVDDVPLEADGINTSFLMVSNGKYSNGGMLVNPFACVNDGLIDLTWVHDTSYMGMFGFREIVNDAKANGGI